LSDSEVAAVDDGIVAMENLIGKLADVPTPAGPTPRELQDKRNAAVAESGNISKTNETQTDNLATPMANGSRAGSTPVIPVLAERGSTQLKAPRGVVLVNTREQMPFDFSRFAAWFSGIEKRALALAITALAVWKKRALLSEKTSTI
jgi:hypothetical protein